MRNIIAPLAVLLLFATSALAEIRSIDIKIFGMD
jgi:hypothetical protein